MLHIHGAFSTLPWDPLAGGLLLGRGSSVPGRRQLSLGMGTHLPLSGLLLSHKFCRMPGLP